MEQLPFKARTGRRAKLLSEWAGTPGSRASRPSDGAKRRSFTQWMSRRDCVLPEISLPSAPGPKFAGTEQPAQEHLPKVFEVTEGETTSGSSPLAHVFTAAVNLRHRVVFELPLDQHRIDLEFVSVLRDFAG